MRTMQRVEGPQTPFEVYCYECQSTFAVGTRRCVHCGRPLARQGSRPRLEAKPEALETAVEEELGAEPSIARRIGGTSLWVLVALAAAASRLCAEGG
jgi:hypothetical protein